jgi:PQQ-dependent catabolism-associated CXXCW motif protein
MAQHGRRLWLMAAIVLIACDRFGGGGGGQPAWQQPGPQQPSADIQPGPQGPQYPQYPAGPQGPTGQPVAGPMNLDQLAEWERRDAGIAATNQLHTGPGHGPTPSSIPGGQVITTKGLMPLLQGGGGMSVIVLDVLGNPQTQLPNAVPAAFAAQSGSFNDAVQQQFGQMLMQLTRGNKQVPIVTYCQGPQCWMSYNAALRAIALGYRNVLWYRGGVEAWQQAMSQMAGVGGQPPAVNPSQFQTPPLPAPPGTDEGDDRE